MEQLTAIDGDIVVFIDSKSPETVYSTDDLLGYLRAEGHIEVSILQAIRQWQKARLTPLAPGWEHFTINETGLAVMSELRSRRAM